MFFHSIGTIFDGNSLQDSKSLDLFYIHALNTKIFDVIRLIDLVNSFRYVSLDFKFAIPNLRNYLKQNTNSLKILI